MSDDDKELEAESDDEGNGFSQDASGNGISTDRNKRAHHNALERKRRDHIKDSFSGLKDSIPTLQGDKTSRAQILKKASEYIAFMKRKNSNHANDIEDLKRQNQHLESQIRMIEEAKKSGKFEMIQSVKTDEPRDNEISGQNVILEQPLRKRVKL